MTFAYAVGAKKRISQLGAKEIIAFLEEVPLQHRKTAFSGLRPISGFRKNEPTELKKRIENFGTSLAQSHRATERDWSILGEVWNGWGQYTFAGRIGSAFKKYREEKSSLQSFLRDITGDEDEIDVAMEDIERIFLFSPFDSMDEAGDALSMVPTRKELERSRKIAKIPSDITELRKTVSSVVSDLEQVKKTLSCGNSSAVEAFRGEVNSLKIDIEKFEKRCLLIEELSVSQHKALNKATDISSRSNEMLARKIAANEVQTSSIEKSSAEISASFKAMEGVVKSLQKTVGEQDKERGHRKTADSDQSAAGVIAKAIGMEVNRSPTSEPLVEIANARELLNALVNNYVAIGVAESAARKNAIAVTVAVMSGQFVQFSGSLADTIADATLLAVSGESHLVWNVPAGLCDSELTSAIVRKAVDPKQPMRGLLLRGLNKSAFDVYGYDIRNVLVNRLMGIGQRHLGLTLVATWLDGSSSLPERDSLAELGPMIDTNALVWTKSKGQLARYVSPVDGWDPLSEKKSNERDLSELSNQVSELPIYKSELWRRGVRYAVKSLSSFPDLDDTAATETLLLNWVFPWAIVHNIPNFDITTFFKEHFPTVQDNPALMAALDRYSGTST